MAQSLSPLVSGYRIANVYDVNPRTYVLKLTKPDSPKLLLLIESGVRFHLTQYARDKGDIPSGFTMKLRKHLKSKRIEEITQVASDRVVVFGCGSGEARYHLIVELYDKGNVVLTDAEHNILTLLRSSKHDADARVTVNDKYPLAASRSMPPISREWLVEQMMSAQPAQYLHAFLVRTVPLGRELIDHSLACSNYEAGIKMGSRPWEMDVPLHSLVDALKQAVTLFGPAARATAGQDLLPAVKEPGAGDLEVHRLQGIRDPIGIIVLRECDETQDQAAAEDAQEAKVVRGADDLGDGALFVEFAPYELRQFASRRLHRFAAFWEAVDEYFSKMEKRRVVDEVASRQAAAWKKVDKVKESQASRVIELRAKEEEDRRRGEMIELRAGEVDALLSSVRAGLSRGMDWDALAELIDDAAKAGDELAAMVVDLDLAKHSITIALEEQDEEATEEELTRPATLVQLDVRQSAHANARAFYVQKKAAASKTAKTIAAAEGAVRSAEIKATASVAAIKVSASIRAVRKAYWFEKFAWFISSENLLVITGHDGQQVDMLVKKHFGPGDVYVHADVEGALPCIIKAHGAPPREIPPLTLSQAGSYVLCRSPAWTSRNVTSAWWVQHEQVMKSPPSGDRLAPGHFLVTGAKQYLPPTQLLMGFGVLFKVAPACVAAHLGQRRVRTDLRSTAADVGGAAESPEDGSESDRLAHEKDDQDRDEDTDLSILSFGPGGKLRVGLVSRSGSEGPADLDNQLVASQATRAPSGKGASCADTSDGDCSGTEHDSPQRQPAANKRWHNPQNQERRLAGDARTLRVAETGVPVRSISKGAAPLSQPARESATQPPAESTGKLKRGQKSKLKKMKDRYADQDEEERALMLGLLGSAGQSKQEAAREAFGREAQERAARDAEKEQRHRENLERMARGQQERSESRNQQTTRHNLGVEASDDLHDDPLESGMTQADAELEELLLEPSIQALGAAQHSMLAIHDTLTAIPEDDDQVLFSIPVCAPYSVLTGYKFRVKLTPGAQKKGKAARQAIGIFCSAAHNATDRQRDLLRAITDDELVRQMIGNVKLVSSGASTAAVVKSERKARAVST